MTQRCKMQPQKSPSTQSSQASASATAPSSQVSARLSPPAGATAPTSNRRLKRLKAAKAANAAQALKDALARQLLQGLLTKTLLKSVSRSGSSQQGQPQRPTTPPVATTAASTPQLTIPLPLLAMLMHHPIQMKPADSENRNERKLFIGMLSKDYTESQVRTMFSSFGAIEECTVLRDSNGQSKGCAFVTYASRSCAISAIKAMNHSQTMKGCNNPLVVKFADTQKEKDQKRQQQMLASLLNYTNIVSLGTAPTQYLTPTQPTSGTLSFTNLPQITAGIQSLNVQQQIAAIAAAQQAAANNSTSDSTSSLQNLATLANLANTHGLNPMVVQNLAALAAASNGTTATIHGNVSGSTSSGNSSLSGVSSLSPVSIGNSISLANGLGGAATTGGTITTNGGAMEAALSQYTQGIQQYSRTLISMPNTFQINLQQQAQSQSPAGKQIEGPEGANLFIYHLPQEFGDQDLVQTFLPFGSVISAKVFIDKQTNLSKCFGFVSYDNPVSAQSAIQAMNGFQVGTKRLKVQLKRSKDASRPY